VIVAPTVAPVIVGTKAGLPTQATVIVQLPAEASLYVDGQLSKLTSDNRTLISPVLQTGQDYVYTLKAEVMRDGKPVTASKEILVRAGGTTRVRFESLNPPPVAEAPAESGTPSRVQVRLPENARLYADGVRVQLNKSTSSFETPKLRPGMKYFYILKAELERDGRTLSQSREVVVESGKQVDVDFSNLTALSTAQR